MISYVFDPTYPRFNQFTLCILKRVNSYIIDEIIRKGYVGKYLI